MSSAGQLVGGVVGAVAGALIGGPTGALYGAQIGLMAGGYLDPPKGPTTRGPRLDDLTVQTSTVGAVIPRAYGTVPIVGNVIWLKGNKLTEVITKKKARGGKGGGSRAKTITYSYFATFAVGLCAGPIVGVRRLWVGPDLFYDAGSDDNDTIAASNSASEKFTLYPGSDIQDPDPSIQSDLGVANTPAWRGLAYLVFNDLPLARYGNSLMGAQIRAEVVVAGTTAAYAVTARSITNRAWEGMAWNGSVFCTLAQSSNVCATSPDGRVWTEHTLPVSQFWQDVITNGEIFIALGFGSVYTSDDDGATWVERVMPSNHYCTSGCWTGKYFIVVTDSGPFFTSSDGKSWLPQTAPMAGLGKGSGAYGQIAWNGSMLVVTAKFSTSDFLYSPTGLTGSWTSAGVASAGSGWNNIGVRGSRFVITSDASPGTHISDDGISWTYYASNFPGHGARVATDGTVFCATSYGNYAISEDGITWSVQPFPGGSVNDWGALAWNGAVFAAVRGSGGVAATIQPHAIVSSTVTLADIVTAECVGSGALAAADIDVSALTSVVRGYRIGSIGTLRSALEPLQAAWPFDVRQHGYKIQFLPRGGASVATIPMADLDARASGSEPGVQITLAREMDSQLPRRVAVKYLDVYREYDPGEQADQRETVTGINTTTLDLPIVMDSTEGACTAQTLLYLYWLERHDVSIVLPPTYLHLEPGDVVTLATPEGNVQIRLTSIHYTADGRLECQAKYANPAIYTPTALGASGASTGASVIAAAGPSRYRLLDLPWMSSRQDGPSLPVAMCGVRSGWPGGVLLQSLDAGTTWGTIQEFGAPGATIGVTTSALGVVESRLVDAASTLSVTLISGDLFDCTELAMFAGANHFAYGDDGRWEIIAARTCTPLGGGLYRLSNFLRGRFGTEWAMGLHALGDVLVLLDSDDVEVVTLSSADIGVERLYRGVTLDADIGSSADRGFTYQGVNLTPLSPIALTGNRDPSTNDWSLSWVRRTRVDGEWRNSVDVPLGESSESYAVEVYASGSYAAIKRTLSVSSPGATYTSADQVADFGSNQATLFLKIYQLSATVGRGYPLTASITR